MTRERLIRWRPDLIHVALLAGAILLVHAPATGRPPAPVGSPRDPAPRRAPARRLLARPGRYELFGSAPREPRIVLEPGRLSFVALRRGEGRAVAWRFPFPSATKLPAVVTLVRQDRTLRLSVDVATIGAATPGEDGAYHGWEFDNLGLLGRDFERLTVFTVIAESYMRIGRSPEGEEMT